MMRDCIVSHPWYQGKNSLFYSDNLSPACIAFICNKDSDVHPLTQIIAVLHIPPSSAPERKGRAYIMYARERRRIRQSTGRDQYPAIKLEEKNERSRGYTDRKLCSPCFEAERESTMGYAHRGCSLRIRFLGS